MLGIDVSKATLVVTLLRPADRHVLFTRSVPNTEEGVAQLRLEVHPEHPWVLEPTGRYGLLALSRATAAGRQVLLAAPAKARKYLQAVSSRAKTDPLDSQGLARFAVAVDLPPYPVKSDNTQELEQLLAARRGLSQSRMRLSQQRQELPAAAASLTADIDALTAQLKALDELIAKKTTETGASALVERLLQVPGIGAVTATSVAACLLERVFESAESFVAFVWLDVRVHDSGKRKGNLGLSHQGDAELRRLLYLAAQANLRAKGSPLRGVYDAQRAKGRSHVAATCILARKLAKLCWSLAKHGGDYDPARVNQQPS